MQGHPSRRRPHDFTQISIPLGSTEVHVLLDVYFNFKGGCKHFWRGNKRPADEVTAQTIDSSATSLMIIICQRL